jgi:DNA helicase-2/ATP-dependent DNA helicase PcrA
LTFQERFNAEVINMNVNYRSLPGIIDHANALGSTFTHPIMMDPATANREGDADVLFGVASDMDTEAEVVVQKIMELHEDGLSWRDMLVCYRCNAQSRPFEEVCIRHKVPHTVLGGTDFYQRKEIADILAYLRVAINDKDDKSCVRAINRPFRFIGKVSVDNMTEIAKDRKVSLMEVARECASGILDVEMMGHRKVQSLGEFLDAVGALRVDLFEVGKGTDLPTALANLIRRTKYEDWIIGDEGSDTAENSRLSNLRELVRTSGRFSDAEKMLEYIDKLAKERRKRKDKGGADLVQLSTVHKVKGLEFPAVFVAGAAEGIIPHGRCRDVEEEKRIFYVAITRAKDHLMVTCPTFALVGGRLVMMAPSRFVAEAGLMGTEETSSVPSG